MKRINDQYKFKLKIMSTLSEQLTSLYESKWDKLMQQLDKGQIKTQCPFVLSVQRNGSENWYAGADIKVMFFGQEVHFWEKNEDLGDTMRAYERFFEEKYVEEGASGYFSQDEISSGNRFMRWGCNGIMSGIRDILETFPGRRAAFLWNNISKLSTSDGRPVSAAVHELEREYFHVIPQEIEILKPDILVFLTGPGYNKYYNYILENFTLDGEPQMLSGIPLDNLMKLPVQGCGLAYKTLHPGAHLSEAEHWKNYQAIIDDIRLNIFG